MHTTLDILEVPCPEHPAPTQPLSTTIGHGGYEGFWAASVTWGEVVEDDRIAANPINRTDPSGLRAIVDVIIHLSKVGRPASVNISQIRTAFFTTILNQVGGDALGNVSFKGGDMLRFNLVDGDETSGHYFTWGWDKAFRYQQRGGGVHQFFGFGLYWCSHNQKPFEYNGDVTWDSPSKFAETDIGGYHTAVNETKWTNVAAGILPSTTPNWPQAWANVIAHEQIYLAMLDHGDSITAPANTIESGHQDFQTPLLFTRSVWNQLVAKVSLK